MSTMTFKQVSSGRDSGKVTMTTLTHKSLISKDKIRNYKAEFKKKKSEGNEYKYKLPKKKL